MTIIIQYRRVPSYQNDPQDMPVNSKVLSCYLAIKNVPASLLQAVYWNFTLEAPPSFPNLSI